MQSFRGAAFARLGGAAHCQQFRAYVLMAIGIVRGTGASCERGFMEQSLVRGVGLRNIVVVFAIGVELHTSATGQAAAALDLPRLAGLASG